MALTVITLINYYGNIMEASRKKEVALVGALIIATFGLGFIVFKQLEKKGITIKLGS